jgi:hypothetical protein
VSARCSNGAANSFLSGLIIRCRAGCDGWRNSSGSLAILAAIRRAQSDLILIKLPIEPLWFKSCLYMRAQGRCEISGRRPCQD